MNHLTLLIKVRSLQKARRDNLQSLQKRLREAKKHRVSNDEIASIYATHGPEDSFYEAEIHQLWTRYLQERAERLMLPLPSLDDESSWEKSHVVPGYLLTRKGIDEVRKSIRNEVQERRSGWLTWLAALTGLIGAISGLVAVVRSVS